MPFNFNPEVVTRALEKNIPVEVEASSRLASVVRDGKNDEDASIFHHWCKEVDPMLAAATLGVCYQKGLDVLDLVAERIKKHDGFDDGSLGYLIIALCGTYKILEAQAREKQEGH